MTRAEAFEIMMVPRQIVSPQGNKPVIGIVQDSLLGVSKFTRRDTFLERDMVFNTLMHLESWDGEVPIPCILKPRPLWSGKQIFSLIIPNVNLKRMSNNHDEKEVGVMSVCDTVVRIVEGEVISGIVDVRTVGKSADNLIHVVWKEIGPDATRKLLTECQKVVNYWLLCHGMSIGIGTLPASTII